MGRKYVAIVSDINGEEIVLGSYDNHNDAMEHANQVYTAVKIVDDTSGVENE